MFLKYCTNKKQLQTIIVGNNSIFDDCAKFGEQIKFLINFGILFFSIKEA